MAGFQPCPLISWKVAVVSLDFSFAALHLFKWACIRENGPRPHQVHIQGESMLLERRRSGQVDGGGGRRDG